MVYLVWLVERSKAAISMESLHFAIGRRRFCFYFAFLLLTYSNGRRSFDDWQLGNFWLSFNCCWFSCWWIFLFLFLSFLSVFIIVLLDLLPVFVLLFNDCISRNDRQRIIWFSPARVDYCILLLMPALFKFRYLSLQLLILFPLTRVYNVIARENNSPVEMIQT
jgi:hypothetical protein